MPDHVPARPLPRGTVVLVALAIAVLAALPLAATAHPS